MEPLRRYHVVVISCLMSSKQQFRQQVNEVVSDSHLRVGRRLGLHFIYFFFGDTLQL